VQQTRSFVYSFAANKSKISFFRSSIARQSNPPVVTHQFVGAVEYGLYDAHAWRIFKYFATASASDLGYNPLILTLSPDLAELNPNPILLTEPIGSGSTSTAYRVSLNLPVDHNGVVTSVSRELVAKVFNRSNHPLHNVEREAYLKVGNQISGLLTLIHGDATAAPANSDAMPTLLLSPYAPPAFDGFITNYEVRSLLKSIRYLHSRGLVHRDIRPCNVGSRYGTDGNREVYLLDLGFCVDPTTITAISYTFIGHRLYCSDRYLKWLDLPTPRCLCPVPSAWDDLDSFIKTIFIISHPSFLDKFLSSSYVAIWNEIWVKFALESSTFGRLRSFVLSGLDTPQEPPDYDKFDLILSQW
jgi:serine/threonine protein kinase